MTFHRTFAAIIGCFLSSSAFAAVLPQLPLQST